MKLVVVSGLSGAGKSSAMNALEDLGYYCVDNLPLSLLGALAVELGDADGNPPHQHTAVAIDARNPGAPLDHFSAILDTVAERGITTEVLFLDARDDVLITRFSETRRRHPLTGGGRALADAINAERELLGPVRDRADLCVDTTRSNLHQLRELIRQRVVREPLTRLSLLFESFGYRRGVPADADMVFDARCLPNPFWVSELRELDGRDPAVREFLAARPPVNEMMQDLTRFLESWIPRFEAENRAYLTVAIGCTGGQHRSVYLAECLAEHFGEARAGVIVAHRELAYLMSVRKDGG